MAAKKKMSESRARQAGTTRMAIIKFALELPGAYEDHPWGEIVAKVRKKVFVFFGAAQSQEQGFGMSVKLPQSGNIVLSLPFAEPTGYGLGKAGWVSVSFSPGDVPPIEMLQDWVVESFKAVAPKKLALELLVPKPNPPAKSKKPAAKKPAAKKPAAKKPAAKKPAAKKPAAKKPAAKRTR